MKTIQYMFAVLCLTAIMTNKAAAQNRPARIEPMPPQEIAKPPRPVPPPPPRAANPPVENQGINVAPPPPLPPPNQQETPVRTKLRKKQLVKGTPVSIDKSQIEQKEK